jgi:hypothetical protein
MDESSRYNAYWLFFVFLTDLALRGVSFAGVLGKWMSG